MYNISFSLITRELTTNTLGIPKYDILINQQFTEILQAALFLGIPAINLASLAKYSDSIVI
jgi:hypothetical protein